MTEVGVKKGKQLPYIIQEGDELLQLDGVQAAQAGLAFCAIVELAESDLKFRRGLGRLVKTPEQTRG